MLSSWNPPKILALRRSEFRFGFDSASDSDVEPRWLSGSGLRTWSVQVKPYNPSSVRIWLSVPNRSHLRRDEFATLPGKSMKAVELVVAQKICCRKIAITLIDPGWAEHPQ